MSEVTHRKLVRDRVPQLLRSNGTEPVTQVLAPDEYTAALLDKLVEESTELRDASAEERLGELADIWEVLTSLVDDLGFTLDEVAQAAEFTRLVRGSFSERIALETRPLPAALPSAS